MTDLPVPKDTGGALDLEIHAVNLDNHTCATWAYLLATAKDLRRGLDELDALDAPQFTATNRTIIEEALAKRFPDPEAPL